MAKGEPTRMNTIPSRRPYQGVVQILQFNWRSYVATVGGVSVALLALPFLPVPGRTVLLDRKSVV